VAVDATAGAAVSDVVGILLAAGQGRRFVAASSGSNRTQARLPELSKLLQAAPAGMHAGSPVAAAAARTLRACLPRVIAVVAPGNDDAQRRLHRLLTGEDCELAINEHADRGIGTSIACGVAAAAGARGWLIALADMPAIAAATISAVAAALNDGAMTAAPFVGARRGHPVGFAAPLRGELTRLTGDQGARSILSAWPPLAVAVADPGCLLDLDTPADFAAARAIVRA